MKQSNVEFVRGFIERQKEYLKGAKERLARAQAEGFVPPWMHDDIWSVEHTIQHMTALLESGEVASWDAVKA